MTHRCVIGWQRVKLFFMGPKELSCFLWLVRLETLCWGCLHLHHACTGKDPLDAGRGDAERSTGEGGDFGGVDHEGGGVGTRALRKLCDGRSGCRDRESS